MDLFMYHAIKVLFLSCFHTTQEVSSWSTIVCIPVSPVAIYPVFKDLKDLEDREIHHLQKETT